eukprot:197374-Pleurochrysis_carterae.AAC.1
MLSDADPATCGHAAALAPTCNAGVLAARRCVWCLAHFSLVKALALAHARGWAGKLSRLYDADATDIASAVSCELSLRCRRSPSRMTRSAATTCTWPPSRRSPRSGRRGVGGGELEIRTA